MKRDDLIVVRGGGDLATGTIHRLWSAGLRVLVLEAEHPAAIRRQPNATFAAPFAAAPSDTSWLVAAPTSCPTLTASPTFSLPWP